MADLFSKKANPKKLKTSDMTAAMAKRWAAPEYAIMYEVGEGTGANTGRYADAVIMSLWPSRGLELHGVEIKVSRSDWKREAANPQKAEAIAKYCDRWWIHTPPGIVDDLSDLPPAWGLREFDGKRWHTIREAEKTEAEPINRRFLAALLRRADGAMQAIMNEAMREAREAQWAEAEKQRERYKKDVEQAVERRTRKLAEGAEAVSEFEAAFGSDADFRSIYGGIRDPKAWGRAARALSEVSTGFGPLTERLRKAADEIESLQALVSVQSGEAA
ncbi:hypothetical protein [Paracoccus methylarcula]|uniref:Uncharacterized protein n=1 Tax=Paracoccus methylarcula TaxID=72022 RepID=A0A422QW39_9RHOB|nr:hypothetical protein [Paracoccus methylarcula]RNF34178.1 hypothetical protein A7A09_012290 [Paracoccus methylarcula]